MLSNIFCFVAGYAAGVGYFKSFTWPSHIPTISITKRGVRVGETLLVHIDWEDSHTDSKN